MSVSLRPLDDRIIILPDAVESQTPSGIILPDQAKRRPDKGVVLGIGPGKLLEDGTRGAMTVEVGDRVIYQTYQGADVESGGQRYKIVREDEVLGVEYGE